MPPNMVVWCNEVGTWQFFHSGSAQGVGAIPTTTTNSIIKNIKNLKTDLVNYKRLLTNVGQKFDKKLNNILNNKLNSILNNTLHLSKCWK